MPEAETARVARQIADLRLQVDALQAVAKNASLPESLKQARTTIHWSAAVIALALIISSIIKVYGDKRVEAFEKRLETLERNQVQSLHP